MSQVLVERDFLIQVDSITSLVAYRYSKDLPPDVRDDLKDLSRAARALHQDHSPVQVPPGATE